MASHRRIASESAAGPSRRLRPLSILSPPSSPRAKDFDTVPIEFGNIVKDLEIRKEKLYYEGYLLKMDDLTIDGLPTASRAWQEVYASLSGTIMSIWPAAALDDADTRGVRESVRPTFLNITDARLEDTAQAGDIAISTAGRNRFLLRAPSSGDGLAAQRWLVAIRLAMFERARLQEIYTANLFLKFSNKDIVDFSKKDEKWSGLVDVRATGFNFANNQWSRMWCSIIDIGAKKSMLQKLSTKEANVHRAQVLFYESKKDKSPVLTMDSIFAAYCTYPEHLSLIESAGIIKLEGEVHNSAAAFPVDANGFALVIPVVSESTRRLSGTGQSPLGQSLIPNILRFLHNIWCSFELYNKPNHLMLNIDHVDAMGIATTSPDLREEQLLGKLPADLRTEQQWRKSLRQQSVLNGHYTQVRGKPLTPDSPKSSGGFFRRKGSDRRVVSESAIKPKPQPLVTTIEEDEEFRQQSLKRNAPHSEDLIYTSPNEIGIGARNISQAQGQMSMAPAVLETRMDHGRPRPILQPLDSPLDEPADSLRRIMTDTTEASTVLDAQVLVASPVRRPLIEDSDEERSGSPIGDREGHNGAQRPTALPARIISRDSQRSYRSEASVYSDGLDPSALDLVQTTPDLGIRDEEFEPAAAGGRREDGEESIYSNDMQQDSDYGSTIGEAPIAWDKESVNEAEAATRVRRRSRAAELLDLPRRPDPAKADNPYVRQRMRSSRDASGGSGSALSDHDDDNNNDDDDDEKSGMSEFRKSLGREINF